ncbi:MAG: TRAP transporter substrate-binding protein [Bosea sp.]|jgi:tripartite ATP-independent transporter DctP family solute receptor|uniref:DctP family TRAP transporter solute-binding subunit n=2 Tax=Hyphomicrobiales TaxID=356 RepID=UPI00082A5A36|nr:TRAP transporter substrate-binding protein [Bosea sp. (in: a-proteobacteria)]MCP4736926.1 TRAP transporter substrate-binding protein [Bosea sp. (in: a-proteobacteria)]MDX3805041.1 TRAP transporter substrate-binding protein [Bosea sp. (in: a-proteobacteria)]
MTFKAAFFGVLAACAASAANAQTILKFAHADQQNSARHAGVTLFAQKVEELTQGRYKVQVYCCGQLGSDPKVIEQLGLGGVDLTISSTGSYAPYIPTLNLTMLPFAFETYEQGWKFYDESAWLKEQFAKAPTKGFRFLAPWEGGFRNMTTREPLNGPDDAKGKKLRSFANEMMRWSLEAMGFGVQIMPLPEVYMAIQQGVVAGQENPIDMINGQKFYEVAPHVTITNHVYSPTPVVISERTWQRLPEADRALILRAAQEVTPFMRKLIKDNDETLLAEMETKNAKVNRKPDIAAFRRSVEPVYEKAREKYGADAKAVLEEAAAIRAQAK